MSRLEIFFQDALGIADGLKSQFLVAHRSKLHATDRKFKAGPAYLFPGRDTIGYTKAGIGTRLPKRWLTSYKLTFLEIMLRQ